MDCFRRSLSELSLEKFLLSAHFGFSEYAISFWSEHLLSALELNSEDALENLVRLLQIFLEAHFRHVKRPRTVPEIFKKIARKLQQFDFFDHLTQALTVLEDRKQPNSTLNESYQNLDLEDNLSQVRKVLDRMCCSDESIKRRLQGFYGPNLFKCSRFNCKSFHEGFVKPSDCTQHQDRHERRFQCTFESCPAAITGLNSSKELAQHIQRTHERSPIVSFSVRAGKLSLLEDDVRKGIGNGDMTVLERLIESQPNHILIPGRIVGSLNLIHIWETAIKYPNDDILDHLECHTNFNVDSWAFERVMRAAITANLDNLTRQLIRRTNTDSFWRSELEWKKYVSHATLRNKVAALRFLVDARSENHKPLHEKVAYHNFELACRAGLLLAVKFWVVEQGVIPIQNAQAQDERAIGRIAINRLSKVIFSTVERDHVAVLGYLLSLDSAKRAAQTIARNTLLETAEINDSKKVLGLLVNHGRVAENAIAEDAATRMKFYYAVRQGKVKLVEELLRIRNPGYKLDFPDRYGCSIFMHAAFHGMHEVISCALRDPALDVNRCGKFFPDAWAKVSAMTLATRGGHTEVVHLLLQHPTINPYLEAFPLAGIERLRGSFRGTDGVSTRELAEAKGFSDIAQLLDNHESSELRS